MRQEFLRCLLAGVLVLFAISGTVLAQQDPQPSISQIAGDLYRYLIPR